MDEPPATLLADANVLIDYLKSDLSIITLVTKHVGPVYVIRQVLDTVHDLSDRDCRRHRIQVIELQTHSLIEAGSKVGALSFEDWLCFIACRDQGWTCLTNDSALIRECGAAKIPVRRGLGLMVDLVRMGVLERRRALRVAQAIHRANPFHINQSVLKLFRTTLGDI